MLTKLGVEHPYHTLYHLLALSNGNRGSDGRPVRDPLAATGGMSHAVDPAKVAAADSMLRKIAAAPNRYSSSPPYATGRCPIVRDR